MSVAYRLPASDRTPARPAGEPADLVVCDGPALNRLGGRPDLSDAIWLLDGPCDRHAASEAGLNFAALDRSCGYRLKIAVDGAVSNPTLALLAQLKLTSVADVDGGDYRRPKRSGAKRALFIFPGMFAPPRIGSHQRAFSTVLDLIEGGYDVDIVLKRRGAQLFDRTRGYFDMLATSVFAYDETPPRIGPLQSVANLAFGRSKARSLAENEARDVTEAGRLLLQRVLDEASYDLVMVSFPWMTSLIDRRRTGSARIVCDTHDVASNRHPASRSPIRGRAPSRAEAAEHEKRLLERCDAILAISESDAAMFRDALGLPNVVSHPLSYHLAAPGPDTVRRSEHPLFGFIGSDMEANRLSLRMTLDLWWPAIRQAMPTAVLEIAGAVSRSTPLSPALLEAGVRTVGYAEDVDAFYRGLDALLSPSVIPAGVNVKNVEALLRGCPVVTNETGARSLRPLENPVPCESAAEAVALLRRLRRREPELLDRYEELFAHARLRHAKPKPLVFD